MQLGPESEDEFHSPVNEIHSEMLYNCKSPYMSQLSHERLSRAYKTVLPGQQDREENGRGVRGRGGKEASLSTTGSCGPAHPSARILTERSREIWQGPIRVLRNRDG